MDLPAGEPAIRTIAMPADTNPAGDIFGGWLMAQMDLAAGNVAARRARGRCATIAVDGFTFLKPVHVGDEVTVYALVEKRSAAPRSSSRSRPGAARATPRRVHPGHRGASSPSSPSTSKGGRGRCRRPGLGSVCKAWAGTRGRPVGKITDTKADIILALRHGQASRRQLVDRGIGPGREWEG